MGDFVTPERVRLTLTGGHFIDIKKQLNHGETEDLYASWAPTMGADGKVLIQRGAIRTSTVLFYLLGWSLTMEDGTPVVFSVEMPEAERVAILRSLDSERFTEIHDAINAHEKAFDQARAALKKTTAGSRPAAVTSSSPSAAGGLSSASATSTPMIMRSSSNT